MKRLVFTLGMLLFATGIHAQPAPIPLHRVDFPLDTGRHSLPASADATLAVFTQTVGEVDAPWLQLHFGNFDLGANSYLRLTSLEDGDEQHFTQRTLTIWEGNSAHFNGGLVRIEFFVAPGDEGVYATLEAFSVGEQGGAPESLCDGNDDRVASNDPAVGRIMPVGCTGWIVSNGTYLSAGHCIGGGFTILEFNVPASDPNGTTNPSLVDDQYPIISSSVVSQWIGQVGQDWAVYDVGENTQTGLTPVFAQNDFFRMTRDNNPLTIRITGYGIDETPPGSTGGRNADNQTEQTDNGLSNGETVQATNDAYWAYRVDTESANSGSPIITQSLTETTLGIHTDAGCTSTGGANFGTSFENDDLENAIAAFFANTVIYLDNGDGIALEDGTVFRPFDTLNEAVTAATSGAVLSIVQGTYVVGAGTFTKAMVWAAPVGSVIVR